MVDINTVYSRVLLLANKEQRGYITPEEFNSFAEQAQLEILDGYFAKRVAVDSIPGGDDEYSDAMMIVEERLKVFDMYAELESSDGTFTYPDDQWQSGVVHVSSGGRTVVADEVSHRDLAFINLSPLTAPTNKQPVYARRGRSYIVYPEQSLINLTYLRKPLSPVWAYMFPTQEQIDMGVENSPIYDAANSQSFELHQSEETELVYRILSLSGVAIKQQDIAQFGASKENK